MERLWRGENTNDFIVFCPIEGSAALVLHRNSHRVVPEDGPKHERGVSGYLQTNRHRGASALVLVEPIPDDLVSLLRLVPEETVTTALHHRKLGTANVVAQMFRGDDMVAGIGIGFIFAAH